MAYSFSANQFEKEFKPTSLCNWEVAKWFPERPRAHKTPTKIIVNDQGHLLPGVQRPTKSPWGTFKGTWQLPKKISRKIASEITAPQVRARRSWEKRSLHAPICSPEPEKTDEEPTEPGAEITPIEDETRATVRAVRSPTRNEGASQPYDNHAYDDYSRPTGQERSPGVVDTTTPVRNAIEEYKQNCSPLVSSRENNNDRCKIGCTEDYLSKSRDQDVDSGIGSGDNEDDMNDKEVAASEKLRTMPPLATAYCNPQIARNLAVENLRHHPLPDTVEDALYRSLQMKKVKHPGKTLDVDPRAAAVGCKGYGVPGPTQCSKLKVYRPKTAGVVPDGKEHVKEVARPKTSNSDYRNKPLSQMQLALCWDLKPPCPMDEPKRSTHIDGSNGSAAPAVFALVRPPSVDRIEFEPTELRRRHVHSGSRPTSTKSASSGSRGGSGSGNGLPKRQPRSAWEGERKQKGANPSAVMDIIDSNQVQLEPLVHSRYSHYPQQKSKENVPPDIDNGAGSTDSSSKLSKSKQHCQSTPNLTGVGDGKTQTNGNGHKNVNGSNKNRLLNNRPCMTCEMKTNTSPANNKLNNDNNNNLTYSNGSSISTIKSQKMNGNTNNVQVPKLRNPYAKRSYSIGTLAPPFSLWPGTTGQGYPEHWRLASVYQHSYKPIQSRRKTFLQSVYQ